MFLFESDNNGHHINYINILTQKRLCRMTLAVVPTLLIVVRGHCLKSKVAGNIYNFTCSRFHIIYHRSKAIRPTLQGHLVISPTSLAVAQGCLYQGH
jgi:hypothetical protein